MNEKENQEEKFNIKIKFYGEEIDTELKVDYNHFIWNICNIFNIHPEQFNSIALSYFDEDGDSIILSTKEDYAIFLQQVKEKIVRSITAEINENSQIDPMACLDSALDYKDKIEQANNQIKIENKQNIFNNDINNNLGINNNQNINNNIPQNNQPNNNNEHIENIIFNYPCSYCQINPIICVLYYCPTCTLYLCEECYKKNQKHEHNIIKIESKENLNKIKEKEKEKNDYVNQRKEMENKQNNDYYYQYYNPNNNNYYIHNNNQNNNNGNYNQDNNKILPQQPNFPHWPYLFGPHGPHRPHGPHGHDMPNFPFCPPVFKEFKKFLKKKSGIKNSMDLFKQMKYKSIIHQAKKQYNLDGVDDKRLYEALEKTDGNIDEAIALLTK